MIVHKEICCEEIELDNRFQRYYEAIKDYKINKNEAKLKLWYDSVGCYSPMWYEYLKYIISAEEVNVCFSNIEEYIEILGIPRAKKFLGEDKKIIMEEILTKSKFDFGIGGEYGSIAYVICKLIDIDSYKSIYGFDLIEAIVNHILYTRRIAMLPIGFMNDSILIGLICSRSENRFTAIASHISILINKYLD